MTGPSRRILLQATVALSAAALPFLAAVFAGCTGLWGEEAGRSQRVAPGDSLKAPSVETPVAVSVIRPRQGSYNIHATGRILSPRTYTVTTETNGAIRDMRVRDGSMVDSGDTLFRLENDELRIQYLRAQGEYLNKREEFEIYLQHEDLADSVSGSPLAIDTAARNGRREQLAIHTGYAQAESEYRIAALRLERTVIRAPIGGLVAFSESTLDMYVRSGTEVLKIVQSDPLVVEVGLLESEHRMVRRGQAAVVTLPSSPSDTMKAVVDAVRPVVDDKTGTGAAIVRFRNRTDGARPGMMADVEIRTTPFGKGLFIPREALLEREERTFAFVYKGRKAQWRYVQTGRPIGTLVQVVKGLESGDTLIVGGHEHLNHGAHVTIAN